MNTYYNTKYIQVYKFTEKYHIYTRNVWCKLPFFIFWQTPATAAGSVFALCQSAGVVGLAASTKAGIDPSDPETIHMKVRGSV